MMSALCGDVQVGYPIPGSLLYLSTLQVPVGTRQKKKVNEEDQPVGTKFQDDIDVKDVI